MLEGTARMLQPNFSLMELIQPYQKKMLRRRLSPARQVRKARRIYSEVEKLAEVLPRRLRDILQQVESGKFDVHLDHRGLEPSVNRLVLGLLTSSLFLGSSLLISRDVWAFHGASVPGTLGVMFERVLGMAPAASDRQIGPARSEEVTTACLFTPRTVAELLRAQCSEYGRILASSAMCDWRKSATRRRCVCSSASCGALRARASTGGAMGFPAATHLTIVPHDQRLPLRACFL